MMALAAGSDLSPACAGLGITVSTWINKLKPCQQGLVGAASQKMPKDCPIIVEMAFFDQKQCVRSSQGRTPDRYPQRF